MADETGVMPDAPLFSVIVTDFEPSVPRARFVRKMQCLAAQTCADFEVIVYHDGPKPTPYANELAGIRLHPATRFVVTDARANDWGHSSRDRGMREAQGRWIIHTNADNLFYPTLIERLKEAAEATTPQLRQPVRRYPGLVRSLMKRSDRAFGTRLLRPDYGTGTERQILIYGILMRGLLPVGNGFHRDPAREDQAVIFGGVPVAFGRIDAMQFVMRRDLWLAEGGWTDRSERGDGHMYARFARRYLISAVPEVLGEHW